MIVGPGAMAAGQVPVVHEDLCSNPHGHMSSVWIASVLAWWEGRQRWWIWSFLSVQ